jgi:hypothetical protein
MALASHRQEPDWRDDLAAIVAAVAAHAVRQPEDAA